MGRKDDTEPLVGKKHPLTSGQLLTTLYDDQKFIDCFQDATDYKSNQLEFMKDNDYYLNPSEVEIEGNIEYRSGKRETNPRELFAKMGKLISSAIFLHRYW